MYLRLSCWTNRTAQISCGRNLWPAYLRNHCRPVGSNREMISLWPSNYLNTFLAVCLWGETWLGAFLIKCSFPKPDVPVVFDWGFWTGPSDKEKIAKCWSRSKNNITRNCEIPRAHRYSYESTEKLKTFQGKYWLFRYLLIAVPRVKFSPSPTGGIPYETGQGCSSEILNKP